MKRYNIVEATEDGGIRLYPMKEWLRQHPERIPSGLDATASTSHQLRSGLRRAGWSVQETPTEVRFVLPSTDAAEATVHTILGEDALAEEAESPEAAFGLEYQLRDFIAQNISLRYAASVVPNVSLFEYEVSFHLKPAQNLATG